MTWRRCSTRRWYDLLGPQVLHQVWVKLVVVVAKAVEPTGRPSSSRSRAVTVGAAVTASVTSSVTAAVITRATAVDSHVGFKANAVDVCYCNAVTVDIGGTGHGCTGMFTAHESESAGVNVACRTRAGAGSRRSQARRAGAARGQQSLRRKKLKSEELEVARTTVPQVEEGRRQCTSVWYLSAPGNVISATQSWRCTRRS